MWTNKYVVFAQAIQIEANERLGSQLAQLSGEKRNYHRN